MAWLERKGQLFRIRFRYGGRKMLVPLKTKSEKKAQADLTRFEENLQLADRGRLVVPDDCDVGLFLLSDGTLNRRLLAEAPAAIVTLASLFADYKAIRGTKEATTRYTENIHLTHLERLLGANTKAREITGGRLQTYITTRRGETSKFKRLIGSRTVKKEIGTFAAVWNGFGVRQGLVAGPAPTVGLDYGKEKPKLPFQTREQIERQIARGGLSRDEAAAMWDGLFLTLPEVEAVLDLVHGLPSPAYVYPMFVIAAHTGARRSEILRSRIEDFDFAAGLAMIRERKKDTSTEETYRTVPLTPRLAQAMKAWLSVHPGGAFTVCTDSGQPISVQLAGKTFVRVLKGSALSVLPGWHCFRHSFISNCVAKGIDQRLIDQWVGHTTEAMRRRYTHLVPKVSREALLSVFGSCSARGLSIASAS